MRVRYEDMPLVHVQLPGNDEVGPIGYMGRVVNSGDQYSLVFSSPTHAINQIPNAYITYCETGDAK